MQHLPLYNECFEQLYKEFDLMIKTKNYSRGKNTMYQSCVREFLFFTENRGITTVKEINAAVIISYYEYLRERPNQRKEGGLSESMIRHHLFSLRLFFDYLLDTDQITSSPARLPKFQIGLYKQRNIVTVEEVQLIYNACENKRDRALIAIAYGCGLRRTEIEKLNTNDVLLHKGCLMVRDGKGGKSRTIPLSDSVLKELKEYLIYERHSYFKENNRDATWAFFINNTGIRMKGDKLNSRLKEIIERTHNNELKRKEITLHCLRHSIATHLIDNGANIEFVQQLLGHSEIDTAHLYSKRRKVRANIYSQLR
jgi:site-specific recombinase XerD